VLVYSNKHLSCFIITFLSWFIQVHENLMELYPSVLVPTPRTPLCAKRVLVMEDLSPATKLADGLRKEASKVKVRE